MGDASISIDRPEYQDAEEEAFMAENVEETRSSLASSSNNSQRGVETTTKQSSDFSKFKL